MWTPTLQAGQEASGTEAALQAAILNVYTPCCVVRQSCNAQDCLFYQLDSLFATLAPHLSLWLLKSWEQSFQRMLASQLNAVSLVSLIM